MQDDMSTHGTPELSGDLIQVPFTGGCLQAGVKDGFQRLQKQPEVETILVLTREQNLVGTVEDWLDESKAAQSTVQVDCQSLTQHAAQTRSDGDTDLRIATFAERSAVLVALAEKYEWEESAYLESASKQDSFITDLSALVTAILTQDITKDDVQDDDFQAVIDFAYEVDERLKQANRIDLSRVIHMANSALEAGASVPDPVPDGVLCVNFEEFTARERQYLSHISEGRRLLCVAQESSSVYRVGEETGDPCTHPGLTQVTRTQQLNLQSKAEAVAVRLATGQSHRKGDLPGPGDGGEIIELKGESFETHIRAMADEIHRLRNEEPEYGYDDFAVAVRDTSVPVSDVVQILWNQNIPVTTTVANGLEYDPAARELYYVLASIRAMRSGNPVPTEYRSALETRLEEMEAKCDPSAHVESMLEQAVEARRFDDALSVWIAGTELKGRVAAAENEIQARISSNNIRQVLETTRFIEEEDICHTWDRFVRIIERFYEFQRSDELANELETSQDGVVVDTARGLKGGHRRTVFVVGAVDGEFPTDMQTNPLFPLERAKELDTFPLFVRPDPTGVNETFPTANDSSQIHDALRAYYAELDRRLLATAAEVADYRLYFGTYRQDRTGLSKYRPSRFLDIVRDEVDVEERAGEDDSKSPERALVATFDESRRALQQADGEDPIEYEALADRFRTVQSVLETNGDDRVRDALQTRVDLLRGEFRRTNHSGGDS